MRLAYARFAAVALFFAPNAGEAQPADDQVPPGATAAPAPDPVHWTEAAERTTHDASGTNCINDVPGFAPLSFMAADAANLLGACNYVDVTGTGDAGLRVRRYVRGEGESEEAIRNDRDLMEPGRMGAPLFAVRMTGASLRAGKMGGRITITRATNGYLVDCFAEGETFEVASAKLASICGK